MTSPVRLIRKEFTTICLKTKLVKYLGWPRRKLLIEIALNIYATPIERNIKSKTQSNPILPKNLN